MLGVRQGGSEEQVWEMTCLDFITLLRNNCSDFVCAGLSEEQEVQKVELGGSRFAIDGVVEQEIRDI